MVMVADFFSFCNDDDDAGDDGDEGENMGERSEEITV